ncbi:MAG: hypothetical protein DRI57_27245 [Deltaproteobacteria bacterium]|nr:MAG: hypothetical protein DRI57_27245 [Deltaproteobacteria bacterium]
MYGHSDNYGTTGIDLRIHYDSSKFTFKSSEILVGAGDVFGDVVAWDDTDNYDNDAATDKYIRVNYDLMAEEWPYPTDDSNLPITDPLLNLFNLTFTAAAGTGTTAFNVTADQKAATAFYDFTPTASGTVTLSAEVAKPKVTTSLTPATGAGTISPAGTTEHEKNSSPVYEITVATGYRIKECKVNDTVVEVALKTGETDIYQYSFDPLTADATISVEFEEIPKFKITSSAGDNGTIAPLGDNEVLEGATAVYTITITGAHYEIDTFTVSTDSSAFDNLAAGTDPNTFTYTFDSVSAAANVNVTFKLKIYKVTSTADTGGSISDPGEKKYGATAEVTRTITPLDGYEVATFTVDGGPDVKDTALTKNADGTSTYTIASLEKDTAINVTFKKLQYTVTPTVTGDGGTITPATATAYDAGTDVEIVVTPDAGYKVKTFTVDTDATAALTDNKYTLAAINANVAVTVTFELDNQNPVATTGLTLDVAPGETAGDTLTGYDLDAPEDIPFSFSFANGTTTLLTAKDGIVKITDTVAGTYTYKASSGAEGVDSFTFIVTDSKGGVSEPATVNVTFVQVCTLDLVDDEIEVAPGATKTGKLDVTYDCTGTLSYSVIAAPAKGRVSAINTATGDFTYKADGDATGTDTFTIEATDGTKTDTGIVTVSFGPPNTDPEATSTDLTAIGGEVTSGTLVATDADEDTLSFTITQVPTKGAVVIGTVTTVGVTSSAAYTYTANDTTVPTTDTFFFTVDDGKGGIAEGTITVNIVPAGEYSSADMDRNYEISLSELLSVQQLYTSGAYHCDPDEVNDDGYAIGSGDQTCTPHTSDYTPQDWEISLSEFLRITQFYNLFGYHVDPDGEDGFAAGPE